MHKVLVIGASGKIGYSLVSKLAILNFHVFAMVRDKYKCFFSNAVTVVEGDLESNIAPLMDGVDSIIFSAGSGSNTGLDKTLLVDLWGAKKAIDAAKAMNVKHFIMISSRGADNPDNGPEAIKPYLVSKYFADEHLKMSGLQYTILRPGRLTDEAGIGLINTTRPNDPAAQLITREDTIDVICHCLQNEMVLGKTYELYAGLYTIDKVIN